jgi:hypothetical protein
VVAIEGGDLSPPAAATHPSLRTPRAAGRAFPERDLEQADAGDSAERAQAGRRPVARRRDLTLAAVVSGGRVEPAKRRRTGGCS